MSPPDREARQTAPARAQRRWPHREHRRPRRRRHRRRRRPGGLRRRPTTWPRPAPTCCCWRSRVPAREGLRRRAHPARGQGRSSRWASTPPSRPAGCTTRACGSSAAACASSCPGPTSRASPTTAWSARAVGLRRPAGPPGGQGGRDCCARTPTCTVPVLDDRTGRITGVTRQATRTARRHLPRPAGRRRRRQLQPALARAWGCTSATTARWASPSAPTTRARATTTTGWSRGSSSGTAAPTARERLLPGYGWIFGVGDGTSNVGLGILNTSTAWGKVDYKDLLKRWLDQTPEEWGYREENRTQPVRGAALPMGFNRQPHYTARPAAGRRLRRHGQPVQRRGHRLRHGVRPSSPPRSSPRRWPARRQTARERALAGLPADPEVDATAATTRSAGSS